MKQSTESPITRTPWVILGIPRSMWKRWGRTGATPPPLPLPGAPLWDCEALKEWYRSLARQEGAGK